MPMVLRFWNWTKNLRVAVKVIATEGTVKTSLTTPLQHTAWPVVILKLCLAVSVCTGNAEKMIKSWKVKIFLHLFLVSGTKVWMWLVVAVTKPKMRLPSNFRNFAKNSLTLGSAVADLLPWFSLFSLVSVWAACSVFSVDGYIKCCKH